MSTHALRCACNSTIARLSHTSLCFAHLKHCTALERFNLNRGIPLNGVPVSQHKPLSRAPRPNIRRRHGQAETRSARHLENASHYRMVLYSRNSPMLRTRFVYDVMFQAFCQSAFPQPIGYMWRSSIMPPSDETAHPKHNSVGSDPMKTDVHLPGGQSPWRRHAAA